MRLSVVHLRHHPRVFKQMTGLTVAEFEEVVYDLLPSFRAREQQRFWPHARLSGGNATRPAPSATHRARQCGGEIDQPLPGRGVPMIDRIGEGVVSASPLLCTLTVRSVCFGHACKHRIAERVPQRLIKKLQPRPGGVGGVLEVVEQPVVDQLVQHERELRKRVLNTCVILTHKIRGCQPQIPKCIDIYYAELQGSHSLLTCPAYA